MKPATNRLAGRSIELERCAHLLDATRVHHDDLVGHGHRLDLVVGDIDRRRLQPLVQFLDLGAHLHAQLGVEIGERLVEQEDLADRARWRGPSRRAGAGRPKAGADSGRGRARARGSRPPAVPAPPPPPCRCRAASARRPCSAPPSCADRARSSGTPWRCRAWPAAGGSRLRSPMRMVPPVMPRARRSSGAGSTCRSPTGRPAPTNSPSAISRSTPWRIWTVPNAFRRSRTVTFAMSPLRLAHARRARRPDPQSRSPAGGTCPWR